LSYHCWNFNKHSPAFSFCTMVAISHKPLAALLHDHDQL
jgi:hypothetical protein